MFEPHVIALVFGCLLILIAIVGGGLEIKELKVPRVNAAGRALAFAVGIAFIVLGLLGHLSSGTDQTLTAGLAGPFFMERPVRAADLAGKSRWELDLMRNEIYARHGRRFTRSDLQRYFDKQPWYHPKYTPDEFPAGILTPVQRDNVAAIEKYER